ncbi:bifunctional acetate--CoA ligase family protein/GNAT family N-acetyltransferase [Streptomyces sp. AN091965]|uniref:bifunctional acetate--CoA ligase family protein/GNAT family N-acetyltransferase n=1 Tax=Streptomyces sp. AN091965 TaxID=2927803 RepID=UPI001F60AD7C|nr:bifunctional GNAT family N-acetyltransferase/acetate--CoA ligase family protein [Streptomyces sp. AN091965]MCI3928854.1 bifunctional GNAT family N-acetyltransferase/acetate--CoA ligase family protein [Streptomyces sp. AN091965]
MTGTAPSSPAPRATAGESTHALLADGTTIRLRCATPDDHDAVLRLYEAMSPEYLRFRFFVASRRSAAQAAARVRRSSAPRDSTPAGAERSCYRALLAEHEDRLIGITEYEVAGADLSIPGQVTAEIALAVADDWHHRGVGTLLLEHLVSAARADGVTAFTADALADNHEVLKVFADLGLSTARHFAGNEVRCVVQLEQTDAYLTSVEARGRTADVASLRSLLRPESVVIVGAGSKPGSVGRAVLRNLRTGGFQGRVYAVNPRAVMVLGVHAYPSVGSLPQVPDLAVLAVPAERVPDVAEECGKFGVRALLTVSSGLDAAQARALLDACRTHGMRLVGPNCLGLANTEADISMDATFAAAHPAPGTAGVAVQSGGVGIALLGGLARLGVGVSSFVSLGDKYDVSGNDLLQWWECDGTTDLALLHLESFGNPRAFSRTARRVTRQMPILTVDAGRTEAGRAAAASHTAAAATGTMTRRALFAQAGVTATDSVSELLEAAALLHSQPLPSGPRVAVVTNAGGAGVLAADACAEAGLSLPPLDPCLIDDVLGVLPAGAAATNPVDVTAAVSEEQLRACVDRVAASGCVDAVLVALVPTAVAAATGDVLVRSLTHAPDRCRDKTVAAVLIDQEQPVRLLPDATGTVPAYAEPQAAARALAHAVERGRWLARPPGTTPALAGVDAPRARAAVDAYLDRHPEGGWLGPDECAELLDCYGIPQLPWAWAETEDDAVLAAERLKGPDGLVVLKAHWPGLLHKAEQRALHLDLRGDSQVRAAFRDLETRFGHLMTGVVVQPLAARGTELFAGVVQDEIFGPLVLFGLGGTATEVLADHAARLAPLTDHDAHDLITAPRCAPLLFGRGGGGPVDLEGLEQLLLRLSRLAEDLPQLAEADLNPVLARPERITPLDVRIRLLPRYSHDPYLRQLRQLR